MSSGHADGRVQRPCNSVGHTIKILVEAVSTFRGPEVLSVAPRVLLESVRLFGLEAIIVLVEDMSMLTDAVKVLVESVKCF